MPSYAFDGTLRAHETKTWRCHEFEVPHGTVSLDVVLSYSPVNVGPVHNLLTLGLFDTQGFRGEAHRDDVPLSTHIEAGQATPGFLPGPLAPGRWAAQVSAHAVLESDPPCRYHIDVIVQPGEQADPPAPFAWPDVVLTRRAGWYRGELHTHTFHSDGSWSVDDLRQNARLRGLDFLCLTDHNTVSQLSEALPFTGKRPLLIPGMELTTFHGHALALGVRTWIDWRSGPTAADVQRLADAVQGAGGLFAMAHPFTIGDPMCTGCAWHFPIPQTGLAAMEVWNGFWFQPDNENEMNLALWQRQITAAGGPTAIAGSDVHSPTGWKPGAPCVWVYARELSAAAILDGIRAGRVTVSSGPWLELRASPTPKGRGALIGSRVITSRPILRATWNSAPAGAKVHLLRGRDAIRRTEAGVSNTIMWDDEPPAATWYHAEMRAENGALLALTNPVYIQPHRPQRALPLSVQPSSAAHPPDLTGLAEPTHVP